jgi:hypothetical protein
VGAEGTARAFAANGAASVLGSILAVALALAFGLQATLAAGAVFYLGAAASARRLRPATASRP